MIPERKVPMATKADFTEQEWKALQKGVMGAGFLVSISDRDFTDTFGEVGALAKQLAEEHEKNTSELIRELSATHGSGFGLTASEEEVEKETLDSLRTGTAALASKAPEELDGYRQLVLGVAERVANAKSGVSETETAAIEKIKEAVGAS
jgi:hypothetical protein